MNFSLIASVAAGLAAIAIITTLVKPQSQGPALVKDSLGGYGQDLLAAEGTNTYGK
jgi:hypothetical protein